MHGLAALCGATLVGAGTWCTMSGRDVDGSFLSLRWMPWWSSAFNSAYPCAMPTAHALTRCPAQPRAAAHKQSLAPAPLHVRTFFVFTVSNPAFSRITMTRLVVSRPLNANGVLGARTVVVITSSSSLLLLSASSTLRPAPRHQPLTLLSCHHHLRGGVWTLWRGNGGCKRAWLRLVARRLCHSPVKREGSLSKGNLT